MSLNTFLNNFGRLGPFSLIKLPNDERHQALDAFQHFTAVERLRFKPALKGSKRALAALANNVDVRRPVCERFQATKMKKLSKIKQAVAER